MGVVKGWMGARLRKFYAIGSVFSYYVTCVNERS